MRETSSAGAPLRPGRKELVADGGIAEAALKRRTPELIVVVAGLFCQDAAQIVATHSDRARRDTMAGFCRNCGSPLADGQGFCTKCGTRVAAASRAAPPPAAAAPHLLRHRHPQLRRVCDASGTGSAGCGTPRPAGMSPLVKILIAVVILFVVLGAFASVALIYIGHRVHQKATRTWLVALGCRAARQRCAVAADRWLRAVAEVGGQRGGADGCGARRKSTEATQAARIAWRAIPRI